MTWGAHNAFPKIALVFVIAVALVVDAKPAYIRCARNEYLSLGGVANASPTQSWKYADGELPTATLSASVRCVPCSTCPTNEIVRRPCSKLSDTVCGPLYRWEFSNDGSDRLQIGPPRPAGGDEWRPSDDVDDDDDDWKNEDATSVGGIYRTLRLPGWHPHGPPQVHEQSEVTEPMAALSPTKDPGSWLCESDERTALCYGLIYVLPIASIAMIMMISVSLYAVYRMYSRRKMAGLRRSNGGPVQQIRHPQLIMHHDGSALLTQYNTPAAGVATPTIAVDRRVRHLETQLYRQRQQNALRLFGRVVSVNGSTRTVRNGNDYVDFRSLFRMIRATATGCGVTAADASGGVAGADPERVPLPLDGNVEQGRALSRVI